MHERIQAVYNLSDMVQEGVLFDAGMLAWVLKRACPAAHKHLQLHEVEPLMFATDWLMCLFTRHLPFNTLLRVWDLFFCYGTSFVKNYKYSIHTYRNQKLHLKYITNMIAWKCYTVYFITQIIPVSFIIHILTLFPSLISHRLSCEQE